jgi:DNA-binding FadR family transcriptional regulator
VIYGVIIVSIKPIVKSSLVTNVVERIRSLIETGGLQAGDRLPSESDLVERLGVSRGALREAVRQLETLGLLSVAHGRGMFVSDGRKLSNCAQLFRSAMAISPKDSLQFAEFRRIIECYTARRAAELATEEDIAGLEQLRDEMAQGGGNPQGLQADWQFHRKLAEMTGNELLINVMSVLQEFVMAGMWHTTQVPDGPEEQQLSNQLHTAIVNAIRAHDPDASEQAMHSHMDGLDNALKRAEQARSIAAPPRRAPNLTALEAIPTN